MEEIIRNLDRIRDNNVYFSLDGEIISGKSGDIALFGKDSVLTDMLQKNHTVLRDNNLDFSDKCHATINVNILPKSVKLTNPIVTLNPVYSDKPAVGNKSVSFSKCRLSFDGFNIYGILYFPHSSNNQTSTVEIIAPYIPGLKPGDRIKVEVNSKEFSLLDKGDKHNLN